MNPDRPLINFKLYATLSDYLPEDAINHCTSVEITKDTTPNKLVELHRIPLAKAHLVLLNGVYLDSSKRNQPILSNGDTLAIWPPVAGG